MRLLYFLPLTFTISFMMGGPLHDPILALAIATFYTMGATGLITMYHAAQMPKNPQNWTYLTLGGFLVIFALFLLEFFYILL